MVKRVVLFSCVAVALAVGAYLITFGWPAKRSPEPAPAARRRRPRSALSRKV
jgi:hypothetical protein